MHFNPMRMDVMQDMIDLVAISKNRSTNPSVSELGKFDPSKFDICKEAFHNLASNTDGHRQMTLCYLLRDRNPVIHQLNSWMMITGVSMNSLYAGCPMTPTIENSGAF
jgi:hypothetical protein